MDITIGTPQGTALRSLLFLIKSKNIWRYDDTVLLVTEENWPTVQTKIESDMRDIIKWLEADNLKLNFRKTNLIKFSLKIKKIRKTHKY